MAYSVHDLDDFYRAGLIPLEHLRQDFEGYVQRFEDAGWVDGAAVDRQQGALPNLVDLLPVERRYNGTYEERVQLRTATSRLINHFVAEVGLEEGGEDLVLDVPEETQVRMRFLQRLVWDHVIENPAWRLSSTGSGRSFGVCSGRTWRRRGDVTERCCRARSDEISISWHPAAETGWRRQRCDWLWMSWPA